MIKKMNSNQFMEILEETGNSVKEMKDYINNFTNIMEQKVNLISNIQEYNQYKTDLIEVLPCQINSVNHILLECEPKGTFSQYGLSVHPKIKTSSNVMNFSTPEGYIYKNNAEVIVNDESDEMFKAMLQHDSTSASNIAFKEFENENISFEVIINPTEPLGDVSTNVIELSPYLHGSFDITRVEISTLDDYRSGSAASYVISNTISSVGNTRIFLEQKLKIWKIKFMVRIKFRNEAGRFPFGLKHLYLLNVSTSADSYADVEIKTYGTVKWISEEIIVTDQYGEHETTCEAEGITLYANRNGSDLSYQIKTSKGLSMNAIARNIDRFYVHIPLTKGITAIKFKKITNV